MTSAKPDRPTSDAVLRHWAMLMGGCEIIALHRDTLAVMAPRESAELSMDLRFFANGLLSAKRWSAARQRRFDAIMKRLQTLMSKCHIDVEVPDAISTESDN